MDFSMKLMVVEDNALEALNVQTIIEAEGHSVIGIANNLADALALAQQQPPDVALIDINLGNHKKEGIALAGTLGEKYGTRILFMSGYVEEFGNEVDPNDRSLGFIIKPFSREQLQNALRYTLPQLNGNDPNRHSGNEQMNGAAGD